MTNHKNALMHIGNDPDLKESLDLLVELLEMSNSEFLRSMFQATGHRLGLFKVTPRSRWVRKSFGKVEVSTLTGSVKVDATALKNLRKTVERMHKEGGSTPLLWKR